MSKDWLFHASPEERLGEALKPVSDLTYPVDWAPNVTTANDRVTCSDCGIQLGFYLAGKTPQQIAESTEIIKRCVWSQIWAPHYTKKPSE